MSEPKTIGVTWLTDRYDDDVAHQLSNATNNLVSSVFSVFGYPELDNVLTNKEDLLFENDIIKTKLGNKSTLSFGATIAILSNTYQEFVIPPDLIAYIKDEISSETIFNYHLSNLPLNETFLIKGKNILRKLLSMGYPSQAAYALAGSFWNACHWDPNKYDSMEYIDNNWSGCSEGLFGIKNWYEKKKLIDKLNLNTTNSLMYSWDGYHVNKTLTFIGNIANEDAEYNKGPYPSIQNSVAQGCLFQLKEDSWFNLFEIFINDLLPFNGDDKSIKTMLTYDKQPIGSTNSEDDDHKLLYAAYMYNSEQHIGCRFKNIIRLNKASATTINKFVEQLLAAYILSQYCIGFNVDEISLNSIFDDKYGNTTGIINPEKTIGLGLFDNLFDYNDYELDGTWWNCVEQMGKWYQNNIHTYQGSHSKDEKKTGRQSYYCPLINDNVEDDCSSFVRACVQLFGLTPNSISTALMQPGSHWDKLLRKNGFIRISYSADKLKEGDIICGEANTHTEIYAGNGKSYAWGNIHDGMNGHMGMPCYFCKTTQYKHIWRYIG